MMNLFPKKSKKGVTLVESVFAVVILAIFAVGILTLLTSGGAKIQKISHEASAYTEATQKLDMVISAVSNGSSEYIVVDEAASTVYLDVANLKTTLGFDSSVKITDMDNQEGQLIPTLYETGEPATVSNVRGWYLKLTYNGATVSGFASNSGGVFDN